MESAHKHPAKILNISTKSSTEKMYSCYICKARFTDKDTCKLHMMSHKRKETNSNVQCKFNIAPIGEFVEIKEVKQEPVENLQDHNDSNLLIQENLHLSHVPVEYQDYGNIIQKAIEEVKHENIVDAIKDEPIENLENHNDVNCLISDNLQCSKVTHECKQCGRNFKYKGWLEQHQVKHRTGKTYHLYQCTLCDKAFSVQENLVSHMMSHTEPIENIIQKAIGEIKHENILDEIKDEPIENLEDHNDVNFLISDNLQRSKVAHECKQCGRKFKYKGYLDQHQKIHTGGKPYHRLPVKQDLDNIEDKLKYQCSLCDKEFSIQEHLVSHMISHTEERKYQCSQCGKAYKMKQHLTKHMKMHTDLEKTYQCSYCDIAFSQNMNFKRHIRAHIEERPCQCRYCYKTFHQKANLYSHERTHAGEKLCQCSHCDQTLSRRKYDIDGTIYIPSKELSIGVLPTKRNVLECMMYLLLPVSHWCDISVKEASEVLARKLIRHWSFANIHTNGWQCVSKDIAQLYCDVRENLDFSISNKEKNSEQWMKEFNTEMENLFDIFCEDGRSRKYQGEAADVKMKKEEYDFLDDMRGKRKMYCENFFGPTWKMYYEQMLKKEKYLCGHQKHIQSRATEKEKLELSYKEDVLMEVSNEVTFAFVDCDYQHDEEQQSSIQGMSRSERRLYWKNALSFLD